MVFVHGTLAGTGYFYKIFPELDRNILSIDLPGFGESERLDLDNPEEAWTMALRTIIEQEIDGNYIIISHSLGSYLVGSMLLRPPDSPVHRFSTGNLEALIFLDPWGFTNQHDGSPYHIIYNHDQSLFS